MDLNFIEDIKPDKKTLIGFGVGAVLIIGYFVLGYIQNRGKGGSQESSTSNSYTKRPNMIGGSGSGGGGSDDGGRIASLYNVMSSNQSRTENVFGILYKQNEDTQSGLGIVTKTQESQGAQIKDILDRQIQIQSDYEKSHHTNNDIGSNKTVDTTPTPTKVPDTRVSYGNMGTNFDKKLSLRTFMDIGRSQGKKMDELFRITKARENLESLGLRKGSPEWDANSNYEQFVSSIPDNVSIENINNIGKMIYGPVFNPYKVTDLAD